MTFETVTNMTVSSDTSKKLEKSQAELRAILEQKLKSIKPAMEKGIKAYEKALKEGVFEDQESEPEGSGERRKETMQEKLIMLLDHAEKMKKQLESKEILSQVRGEFSTTYTHPDGTQETITLNLEQKLKEFSDFYQKTNLDLPTDFEDTIYELWEKHQTVIEQSIEQNGFDDILLIPGNIPLPELVEKMKMENGYFFYRVKEDFSDVTSQHVDKPRIILYHKTETLSEISQKTGLDVHLNITGTDAQKLYQAHPANYLGTLEDTLILERKYLEDTRKHLSDYTKKSAQWLPGSKAGARLVDSCWRPGNRELVVGADDLEGQDGNLGVRPSRCFF